MEKILYKNSGLKNTSSPECTFHRFSLANCLGHVLKAGAFLMIPKRVRDGFSYILNTPNGS